MSELMLMGMRLIRQGITLEQFRLHTDKKFEDLLDVKKLKLLRENNLIFYDAKRLCVTSKGKFVLDGILRNI